MATKDSLSIKEIQNWMQAMLIQHIPVSDPDIATIDMVNSSKRLNATQHLSIYRQSYIARLRACMQTQFKCLAYALGNDLFQNFADEYLDSNPSMSYTLNDLGKNFSAFLEKTRPQTDDGEEEDWPDFMIELAAFEYTLSEVFDMEESKITIAADINTPDDLLEASVNLHLFEHLFPICRYYLDFNAGLLPKLPFAGKSYCAVSRQNYKLGLFSLEQDHYFFLNCLKSGISIAEAKDKMIDAFNFDRKNFESIWPIWRKNFIASGFLIKKN